MKDFSGRRLEIGRLAIEFILRAKDLTLWYELGEELEKTVIDLDSSLGSKITKLAWVVLIVGSSNLAKFRLSYELLSEWEVVGGFWWVVQEELLRHAALYEIKTSSHTGIRFARETRNRLDDLLPHTTVIFHPLLRSKAISLYAELDDLVEAMSQSNKMWDVFKAYSDCYPLPQFAAWCAAWGKELLIQAVPLCPELACTVLGPLVTADGPLVEEGLSQEVVANEPFGLVDASIQTEAPEPVSPHILPLVFSAEVPPTPASTPLSVSQETTQGDAFELVVNRIAAPQTVTSLTSVSHHSSRNSVATNPQGAAETAANPVSTTLAAELVEEVLSQSQKQKIPLSSENRVGSVLKFVVQAAGALLHRLEPQTVDSTVATSTDTIHTSDTEMEEEGSFF